MQATSGSDGHTIPGLELSREVILKGKCGRSYSGMTRDMFSRLGARFKVKLIFGVSGGRRQAVASTVDEALRRRQLLGRKQLNRTQSALAMNAVKKRGESDVPERRGVRWRRRGVVGGRGTEMAAAGRPDATETRSDRSSDECGEETWRIGCS